MKIERAKYKEAYRCAQEVHAGKTRVTDAKNYLTEIGINPNSALDFVYIFRHMLKGEIYKRAMSAEATEDFISWIRRDYGESAFNNSLSALRQHIPYNGGAMNPHIAILRKYENLQIPEPARDTALDDLQNKPAGTATPDRAKRITLVIKRDEKVRAYVIKRANGKCEFCGIAGFALPNGSKYVEAHHIISLASSGGDTLENVIALCANHHREAHYGLKAEELEVGFVNRLVEINKTEAKL